MTKIYVCSRFTHYDDFLFEHFMKYYLNLGVHKFLINFNYKFENDKERFELFLEDIKKSPFSNYIIYNIGPNTENLFETSNIGMLYELVNKHVNLEEDYIIPADSDEFQEFPDVLEKIIQLMKNNDYSYLNGCTKERISETGEIIMVEKEKNIFEQFPKFNNSLFVHPKIGIIKAKYFHYLGVGHHHISLNPTATDYEKEELKKNKSISITNHFRWNLQGKKRLENWYKMWIDDNYKGWKDIKKCEKMLAVFNQNLLEYK